MSNWLNAAHPDRPCSPGCGCIGPATVTGGQVFRVGDLIRVKGTDEPLEVTVVSSSVVFFVRLRWYRRVWLRLRHPMVMAKLRRIALRARESL